MAFEPITTQEQFDRMIQERIGKAKDSVRKEFEGFISPDDFQKKTEKLNQQVTDLSGTIDGLNKKIKEKDDSLAEKDSTIKAYETSSAKMRIAREKGLPYEAVEFLTGEDEEAIGKSADTLKELFKAGNGAAPMADPEGNGGEETDPKDEAFKNMLKDLEGKE